MTQHKRATNKRTRASDLMHRAASYRRFIPDWPALWQSFEREAAQLRAAEKTRAA